MAGAQIPYAQHKNVIAVFLCLIVLHLSTYKNGKEIATLKTRLCQLLLSAAIFLRGSLRADYTVYVFYQK